MKRKELIEILDEQYPPVGAWEEDFIGLQLKGKEDIEKVMTTLDVTLDVINQAIEAKVDMIITHHALIFGDKDVIFEKNKMSKAKYELLEQQDINVYVIHTNADWSHESLAWAQATGLELEKIQQLDNNIAVTGILKETKTLEEVVELIRKQFNLNFDFRTNVISGTTIKQLLLSSGASGDASILGRTEAIQSLVVIGEMKHYSWIYANEHNIAILEIGHFSENIFKDMVKTLLEDNIEVIKSKEENGYRTI